MLLEDEELPEQVSGHFQPRYRATPDAVVVASSGWSQAGWQLLPNGTRFACRVAARTRRSAR